MVSTRKLLLVSLSAPLAKGIQPVRAEALRAIRRRLNEGAAVEDAIAWARVSLSAADAATIAAHLDRWDETAEALDWLAEQGVDCLDEQDEAYPQAWRERLGERAPPVVFVAGEIGLLSERCVGVVGARSASPEALEVARSAGERVALTGGTLVSGGADGVDSEAAGEALRFGGACVTVLADSLLSRLSECRESPEFAERRVCLVSPFAPSERFLVWRAMSRNKLVYALGCPTVVVAAELGVGGTWEGAVEALRLGLGPVFVWLGPGAGPGNQALVQRGARGITDLGELTRPDMDPRKQLNLFSPTDESPLST